MPPFAKLRLSHGAPQLFKRQMTAVHRDELLLAEEFESTIYCLAGKFDQCCLFANPALAKQQHMPRTASMEATTEVLEESRIARIAIKGRRAG
jgi:hypothetical protein